MHGVNEETELCREPLAQLDADDLFRNDLKRLDCGGDVDLRWRVFIPEDDDSLTLREPRID